MQKNDDKQYNMVTDVKEYILKNKLIENNDSIVVGVSGGPDSMCLLDILIKLKIVFQEIGITYSILIAHVNHKIREEADFEQSYVEKFANKHNIPFFFKEANIPSISKKVKLSEEECARNVRYEFFNEILQQENATKIAVAHNLDDDVETIILNVIRGTGLKGLTGISHSYKNIIRPLLNVQKKQILVYNEEKNLNPCFDKTNEQKIYARNRVRLELIPLIQESYNSNISNNIVRMKTILEKEEDFLTEYTNKLVKNSIETRVLEKNKRIRFRYNKILEEHIAIQNRAIRRIIEIKLGDLVGIEMIHISDILKLLNKNIKGKQYIIGNKFTIEIVSKFEAAIY